MNEKLKILAEEIIKQIPTDESNIEYSKGVFIVDEVKYTYTEIEEEDIEDEGKYQNGSTIYGIGLLKEDNSYEIKGDILFYIKQDFSRSGSYYTDYYYTYEKPYIVKKVEKIIKTIIWEGVV